VSILLPVAYVGSPKTYPMVVMKDGVNESSEYRSNRQLLPTPMFGLVGKKRE